MPDSKTKRRGNPVTASKAATQTAIAARRQTVASLALAYMPQIQIAEQLGVSNAPISKDLKAVREDWLTEARVDVQIAAVRELNSLDRLERQLWTQLLAVQEPDTRTRTALAILRCKERRAKMLGFDQPDLLEVTISDERLQAEVLILREELGYDSRPAALEG